MFELIIFFFILWLIRVIFPSSSRSGKKTSKRTKTKTNKSREGLLKEFDLPKDNTSSPIKFKEHSKSGSVEEDSNPVILSFEKKGVYSLWHMTHRNNIENIMRHGILSNTQATNSAEPINISDPRVQRWREEKDPIYFKKIHDYAPTYFNIKNPMLYARKNIQDELCLIEISLSVLSEEKFLFTDGNAAAKDTNFYNSLNDLAYLPWEVLNASYWNDFEDGKRKRCAEVLIYPRIEPKHIKQIHCYSDVTLQQLLRANCNVTKTRELFF